MQSNQLLRLNWCGKMYLYICLENLTSLLLEGLEDTYLYFIQSNVYYLFIYVIYINWNILTSYLVAKVVFCFFLTLKNEYELIIIITID